MKNLLMTKASDYKYDLVKGHASRPYKSRPTGKHLLFRALHGMQTRSGDENSVRLSVKRVICDKMKESCAHILIPHK